MKFFGRIADYIRECDKLLYILFLVTTSFGCIAVLSTTYTQNGPKDFITQVVSMLQFGKTTSLIHSNVMFSLVKPTGTALKMTMAMAKSTMKMVLMLANISGMVLYLAYLQMENGLLVITLSTAQDITMLKSLLL